MRTLRTSIVVTTAIASLSWSAMSFADDKQHDHKQPEKGATTSPGVNSGSSSIESETDTTTTTTTTTAPSTSPSTPSTTYNSSTYDMSTTTVPVTPAPVTPAPAPSYGTTTVTAAPYDYTAEKRETTIRPNRPLAITGGAIAVGSYVPSAIVAGTSDLDADKKLWIPVVGPWIDLAERPCGFGDCGSTQDFNNALLIGSGVAQGAGVALLLSSLFIPEKKESTVLAGTRADKRPVAKPEVRVLPTSVRAGAGVGAMGTF